jgi:hypothetical protein
VEKLQEAKEIDMCCYGLTPLIKKDAEVKAQKTNCGNPGCESPQFYAEAKGNLWGSCEGCHKLDASRLNSPGIQTPVDRCKVS